MALLLALLLAQAQAAPHPCMEDVKKLCPGVEAGGGRISACLQERAADLSEDCKTRVAQFREGAEACEADTKKLCPDSKPGNERNACMQQHKNEVSPACREFFWRMVQLRNDAQATMRACRPDAKKLCKDVKQGGGKVLQCLQQHRSELSPECGRLVP